MGCSSSKTEPAYLRCTPLEETEVRSFKQERSKEHHEHTYAACATMDPPPPLPISSSKVGIYSNAGYKRRFGCPPQTTNQDRGLISYPLGGNSEQMMLAVFDGHGDYGHEVSDFVAFTLPREYELRPPGDVEHRLCCAATATERKMREKFPTAADKSGTTAVAAVLSPTGLTVACVGDSRCVLGRSLPCGGWEAVPLTIDQTGSLEEEAARIKAAGGTLHVNPCKNSCRVIHPEGYSLAMTRALGDWVFDGMGKICDPVFTTVELGAEDRCVILASDGLWEFITSQEAIDICLQHHESATKACRALITQATFQWQKVHQGDYRDDITIIVAFLKDLFDNASADDQEGAARTVVLDAAGTKLQPDQCGS